MERKLQLLESFDALGSDGQHYKVKAYEHLVQPAPPLDGQEHWESTGLLEYRLADGARLDARADGSLLLHGGSVVLRKSAGVTAAV